jgi:aldehyde dehydrogenase (NAD+)
METIVERVDIDAMNTVFESQKSKSLELRLEPISNRKARLLKIRDWIHKNRQRIHEAMFNDFRKAAQEVDGIELFHVLNEIKTAIANLDRWTTLKKVDAPFTMLGTRSHIQYEPKGVCLIISPWNYPFSLAIGPMVSALAAGNTVVIKPSELTTNVASLLEDMVNTLFEKNIACVFPGGPEVSRALLTLPFDHIFFTGSPTVGKLVMKAAASHLASVTLELGGKSPAVVASDANIRDAAERIAVGKFVNNGQTCVAPDYVLVHDSLKKRLIDSIIDTTQKRFAENGSFEHSASYCRIVNHRHFERLRALVSDAVTKGASVEWNGTMDESDRFFHPVILSSIPSDARIMEEEIFGPVLPVISFTEIGEAIGHINRLPKALSLFLFTRSKAVSEEILRSTSAGGACINDCSVHFLHHNLPFGGVNNSGMGKSHGYYGFLAFSNEKSVMRQRSGMTTLKPFYPPYTKRSKSLMDWFLKLF